MKISEIITEDIDEGWKSNLAKVGAGAAIALSNPAFVTINNNAPKLAQEISHSTPARILADLAIKSGIKGNELIALMSQASHETGGFSKMSEKGSPQYFQQKYEAPKTAKILGNVDKAGHVIPGSGQKYKGRGHLQITGKYNYTKVGNALGLPLDVHPEMLDDPEIGAKASLWYWQNRVAPKVVDFGNIKQVTKPINPGLDNLPSREHHFNKIKNAAWPPEEPSKEKGRSPSLKSK